MNRLDLQAWAFINRFQGGFPLVERPFMAVGAQLGMAEAALIETVQGLLERGLLSRLGPLYDSVRLGGAVTLAALSVPEADFAAVGELVNACPEVAHNYRREHALNMWFVVSATQPSALDACLAHIADRTGLTVHDFPRQREFYIGLQLELDAAGGVRTVPLGDYAGSMDQARLLARSVGAPSADDIERLIAATQAGLPLVPRPWDELARHLGWSREQVIGNLAHLMESGAIRRIGAVPNHYRLGLRGNGMTVWDLPDEQAECLGQQVGAQDFVSHAYLRPRHRDVWPYNLFAMVHGRDPGEVMERVGRLERLLGPAVRGRDVLFSSAILKKTGLRLAA